MAPARTIRCREPLVVRIDASTEHTDDTGIARLVDAQLAAAQVAAAQVAAAQKSCDGRASPLPTALFGGLIDAIWHADTSRRTVGPSTRSGPAG